MKKGCVHAAWLGTEPVCGLKDPNTYTLPCTGSKKEKRKCPVWGTVFLAEELAKSRKLKRWD